MGQLVLRSPHQAEHAALGLRFVPMVNAGFVVAPTSSHVTRHKFSPRSGERNCDDGIHYVSMLPGKLGVPVVPV